MFAVESVEVEDIDGETVSFEVVVEVDTEISEVTEGAAETTIVVNAENGPAIAVMTAVPVEDAEKSPFASIVPTDRSDIPHAVEVESALLF